MSAFLLGVIVYIVGFLAMNFGLLWWYSRYGSAIDKELFIDEHELRFAQSAVWFGMVLLWLLDLMTFLASILYRALFQPIENIFIKKD